MRRTIVLLLAVLVAGGLGPSVHAATKAGVTMPDTIRVGETQLRLNGLGLREASIFKVDVYVAGLYVQQPSSDPAQLINSNEVKVLALRFVRDVDRGDILKA